MSEAGMSYEDVSILLDELGLSERIRELEAENERLRRAGYEVGYHDAMKVLGSGMLTAEQVCKAIFNGSIYASYDGAKYYAGGIGMQAIADELNATLGGDERTCKMEPVWGTNALQCSECCSYVSTWDAECEIGKINYCPNCGCKVIGGDE